MRIAAVLVVALMVATPVIAQLRLSRADEAAAFRSAGFQRVGSVWRSCDDPGTPGYSPGHLDQVRDLNGDGRPEAIISEGSVFCYGTSEAGYAVVSKQSNGTWKLITKGSGIVTPLATKGVGGWPDLEIGGPGFCFPVHRWNGREYRLQRRAYAGKPCR
jgi:hypothetical protein